MDSVPPEFDLTELLEHSSWARDLARGLVSDAGVAEDLVQEAWVAALERPPAHMGHLRGWLDRVIRNRARMHGRGRVRRADREHRVAEEAPREAPSAAEVAERFDAQHRLAERVRELREPLRTTVLLRYFEGLDATAIARRTGVPAGTVRWRLKVALDELRERLDDDFGGDRSAWVVLVLPLARQEPAVAAVAGAGLLKGLFALKLSTPLVGVVLLAVAALLVVPFAGDRTAVDGDPVAPATAAGPAADPDPVASAREPEPSPAAGGTREAVAAAAPEAAARTALSLRLLDPEGRPVAGARVTVGSGEGAVASTDAGGDGLLPLPDHSGSEPVLLRATQAGFCSLELVVTVTEGEVHALGDLVLERCGVIEGQVLLSDGAPAALAWVEVAGGPRREPSEPAPPGVDPASWERLRRSERVGLPPVADGSGRFRLEGVPLGVVRLWAGLEGELAALSDSVEVRADGPTTGVEVRLGALAAAEVITGEVLLPEGTPAGNAPLRVLADGGAPPRSLRADEGGRFRVVCRGETPLTVQVPDHTRHEPGAGGRSYRELTGTSSEGLTGGEHLVLRLGETGTFEVVVTDRSGPVRAVRLEFLDPERGSHVAAPEELEAADGRFVVSRPGSPFLLVCTAEGHATGRFGPLEPGSLPGSLAVELEVLPLLRGRVLADGEPVAGAAVSAQRLATVGVVQDGFSVFVDPLHEEQGVADGEGEFALTLREGGRWFVRAEAPGYAPAVLGPVEFDPARGLAGIELRLSAGGVIEGVVRGPDGPVAGEFVVASRGDGHLMSARTDASGRYRLAHLVPGGWQLLTEREEPTGGGVVTMGGAPRVAEGMAWDCVVVEGEVTVHDLEVDRAPTLRGRLTLDGQGPGAWEASLVSLEDMASEPSSGRLDGEGGFELETAGAGRFRLVLQPTDGSIRVLTCELELPEEGLEWSADLSTGSVALGGLEAVDGEVSVLIGECDGAAPGLVHARVLGPVAEGALEVDDLPSGTYTLRSGTMAEIMGGGSFDGGTVHARFEVRAGERTEVTAG